MAGLGRKVFVAGEVLTAAEVQGYLMDQTIMVFLNPAERDAEIPSPTEGMHAYLTGTNEFIYYDGAAWQAAGGGDGGGLTAALLLGGM